MKFFIPTLGPDNTEVYYSGIRSYLTDELGFQLTPRRVHKLSYHAKDQRQDVTVGKQIGTAHETVFAILETPKAYLICTPQRGIGGQAPLVVKRKDAFEVVDFDPLEAQQPA
jgi:hypothetical protein